MVYCGKPSKGCQICRERKIRCDQLVEGCSQCAKAQRTCPGYRDQLELMFRNESTAVVKKAKAKEVKRKQASATAAAAAASTAAAPPPAAVSPQANQRVPQPPSPQTGETGNEGLDANSSQLTIVINNRMVLLPSPRTIHNLAPTLEERATGFFFQTYVIGISGPAKWTEGSPRSMLYAGEIDSSLHACMQAVGLAGFSNISGAPELLKEARRNYTLALRLTNAALKSPVEARKDSTLLAIMILGLFETVTGYNQKSLAAWAQHINGAAALVKLRGMQQFSTMAGLRMFIQVTSSLLVSCIQRELAMPDHIIELRDEVRKYIDTTDPAWNVQEICIQFAEFRSHVKDGTLAEGEALLARAIELDEAFIALFSNVPKTWVYQTIYTTEDSDTIFHGYYHVYDDYWIAQIWNAMRTCRILLNEIIRDEIVKGFSARPPRYLDPKYSEKYQKSTDVLFLLRDHILASVPQHIGYLDRVKGRNTSPNRSPKKPNEYIAPIPGHPWRQTSRVTHEPLSPREDFEPKAQESLPVLRGSAGYFLLWPLYLVGEMDVSTDQIRSWVCNCLRSIGRSMGIQQAFTLAGFIERKEHIAAWRRQRDKEAGKKREPSPPPEFRRPKVTMFEVLSDTVDADWLVASGQVGEGEEGYLHEEREVMEIGDDIEVVIR